MQKEAQMNFEIIDKSGNGWILVKTSGIYTVEDDALMLKKVSQVDYISNSTGLLIDHSKTNFDKVDLPEVKETVQITVVSNIALELKYLAAIMPTNIIGIAEMFKFDLESITDIKIKMFTPEEYKEAVQWIESKK